MGEEGFAPTRSGSRTRSQRARFALRGRGTYSRKHALRNGGSSKLVRP